MVQRWNLDVDLDELRRAAESADHQTYTELVAAVYGAYAKLKGKDRWGDKTPHYIRYMDELDRLFHAQFVHVIRDGREVATSLAEKWWGRSAVTGAFWWRRDVLRAGGRSVPVVGSLHRGASRGCDRGSRARAPPALRVPRGGHAAAAMLEYPNRFDSEEVRIRSHPNLAKPPTADLRDWRAGLTRRQQRAIESVCARAGRARVPSEKRSQGPRCTPGVSGSSTHCGWRQRGPAEGPPPPGAVAPPVGRVRSRGPLGDRITP